MLTVSVVDTHDRKQVNRFIQFHYDMYKNCLQWVPPFRSDLKLMLNKEKHPFFEHSDGDFLIAERDGQVVARLSVAENKPFNRYHGTKKAQFSLFDCVDDQEVANAIFARAFEWAQKRGLTDIIGPKGVGAFDGYGMQVEGFEHRQMMTMMSYNFPYYQALMENGGFDKEVDFVSCYMSRSSFKLPEKADEIAKRVKERATFEIKTFQSKRELRQWASRIARAYNNTFVNNWEYYPLSDKEVANLTETLLVVADPRLIKMILRKDEIVGFLLAFPDISAALQRHDGRITPASAVDMLLEFKRTKWVSLNGVGVLPEYHGRGGNALLYAEMRDTICTYNFDHAEQTCMADTAVQVRQDMVNIGAQIYKRHRVFHKSL